MRVNVVEIGSKVFGIMHKVRFEALKIFKQAQTIDLSVHVWPLVFSAKRGRIVKNLDFSSRACEQVSPFCFIHQACTLQDFNCKQEGEE